MEKPSLNALSIFFQTFIGFLKVNFIRVKGYVNTDVDKKVVVQGIFNDYSYINVDWFPEITELI